MPHFAPGAGFCLAIKVEAGLRLAQGIRPLIDIIADQVGHHRIGVACRIAERQAAHGTDELFELAG